MAALSSYPEEWLTYIRLYRRRQYFECHEVLEELWHKENHLDFWKGLIQLAVAQFHWSRGNLQAAHTIFGRAAAYIAPWAPGHMGLDVNALQAAMLERRRTLEGLIRQHGSFTPNYGYWGRGVPGPEPVEHVPLPLTDPGLAAL